MRRPVISIRLRLTFGALAPLFVAILVCSLTGVYIINSRVAGQAQDKVRTDLNSAREVYQNEIAHIRDIIRFTATSPFTAIAIEKGDRTGIAPLLSAQREHENLDILTAVDVDGKVLFRARNPNVFGDNLADEQLVAGALSGKVIGGTEILSPDQLTREGEELARKATIKVVATPRAKPSDKIVERSGMALLASAPIRNSNGKIIGALYGGLMLNQNNSLVDKIKRIVYEDIRFKGEDVGTATIFLNDLRISTNVQTIAGARAIGTRMSEEVYEWVIVNNDKWVDRAFVVKDWYFSAYEPIHNLSGQVIGSLYVGMLEKPYASVKNNVTLIFGGVLLLGSLIGLFVSGYIGTRLAQPIKELQDLVGRFSAGERDLRIAVTTKDEIGELAAEFNDMTKALALQEEEIRGLNRDLERKVHERTAELEEKNILLVKTREELVRAEKLAAVGELAAGVAHEINNPMAIIRGNAELLQMAIPLDNPSREEVDAITQQVGRVERIVAGLLQFARKKRLHMGSLNINVILDEIIRQIGHQIPLSDIIIRKEYDETLPEIPGDNERLRQLFTNLVLNAIQAMPNGGTITILTGKGDADGDCLVEIGDTGYGIPQANLEQIFNPFFTTKSNGTGLGLSVSYGIVKDHGGSITVWSSEGEGTTFRVVLPLSR